MQVATRGAHAEVEGGPFKGSTTAPASLMQAHASHWQQQTALWISTLTGDLTKQGGAAWQADLAIQ